MIDQVAERFREKFNEEPLLVRSPGRVNLIGEHTDYNEGLVLPAATDKAIILAATARSDGVGHLIAIDLKEEWSGRLDSLVPSSRSWPNYLLGVLDQFRRNGREIPGLNCVFGGDIPIGAGMSSSAAIEAGLAFALNALFDFRLENLDLVKLAQRAENEFVGVRCGIMDQFINIHGRAKKVLKLDCRSLEYEYFPFERPDLKIVVCDSLVRRALASSEYNVRRRQCEEGVRILSGQAPGIRSLRDVSSDLLRAHRSELDPVVYRRCQFVLRENERVGLACSDLEAGDFDSFGRRMLESHAGLRDDYEVSSDELNVLVEASRIRELEERVTLAYEGAFRKAPGIHVVQVESGTHVINS